MTLPARLRGWPRERLAEEVSAASYGTVLVLAALGLLHPDDVDSGLGWELIAGVGFATWAAHLFAEVVGDHVLHAKATDRKELTRAMTDGLPIPLACVLPAVLLLLGRLDVIGPRLALWGGVVVALLQLVGLGVFVGLAVPTRTSSPWVYAATTAVFGVIVVAVKIALGH